MHNLGELDGSIMVGRIYSVYCKDFVSYNNITFFPEQYLNVLTGPNGSGKSTIVSAIILGLGGEPQLLDRSSSIADYVQSGKTYATIIITIYGRRELSKEIFKRVIKKSGESRYYVNDKDLSKSKFLAIVASYNIQVHNLCQFLPQDRVQDFSKMNPQELLFNTMSSVCDDQLIRDFNQLKELRTNQLSAQADREKEKENLKKQQKRLEQLQITVDQYQERQEIQQKINIYNIKKLWTDVTMGETKLNNYKIELEKLAVDCEKLRKTYENDKLSQEIFMNTKNKLRDESLEYIRQLIKNSNAKTDWISKLERIKNQINQEKTDFKKNKQELAKSSQNMEKVRHLLDTKQHELTQFNNHKLEVLEELENQKKIINKTRETTMNQYNKRRDLETRLNDEKIPEITALLHKIERLQNIKTQKMEELRHRIPNLITAMNWVAQNKHNYKANIYDPMIFELSIRNDEGAMYLENVIRQRDLYAFMCEDKSDMSELINELCVKQKLSVNILYCAPGDRCLFKPSVSLAEISQLGFTSYLFDLVSGPIPIINKLCSTYQIHNIPIGKDEVSNFSSQVPSSIRIYFGGTKKFTVTLSRYREASNITESTIHRKNQLICLDSKQLRALKERHAQSVLEKDQIRNMLGEVDGEFDRLQIVLREEGEKRRKIEQKLTHYGNLENEVKILIEKIDSISNSLSSLDEISDAYKKSLLLSFKKISSIEDKLVDLCKSTSNFLELKCISQGRERVNKKEHECLTNKLLESEDRYKNSTSAINKCIMSIQNQEAMIKSKTSEVQRLCNGQLPTNDHFSFKIEFDKISKLDVKEVHEAIVEFQARLDCMKNVNSEAISDYNQRQSEIEQLRKRIENQGNDITNVEENMSTLFTNWETKINALIAKINTKFSYFMESISYVGEIVLSRKATHDFDSYGIQIMVQYRKDAKLQTLDKYVQSGGERAVAIAIYSLSLQHVTNVPFRCVDEINQGMDAKNERHIFDILLKEAAKAGSAQYLFVTPKLLRDLNYNEHLSVSIVHNSGSIKPDVVFPLN